MNAQSQVGGTYIASGSIVGLGAVVDPEFEKNGGTSNTQIKRINTGTFQRITNGGSFTCNSQDGCSGKTGCSLLFYDVKTNCIKGSIDYSRCAVYQPGEKN